MIKILLSVICFSLSFCFDLKQNLSEYQIFLGNPKDLLPSEGFIHYELITPLLESVPTEVKLKIPKLKKVQKVEKSTLKLPSLKKKK